MILFFFKQMVMEQLDINKDKFSLYLISKWITDLHVKVMVRRNIGENLLRPWDGKKFREDTKSPHHKKNKTDNLGFIIIRNICSSKNTIQKKERGLPTDQEKIFAKHIFGKGPVSRFYKEVIQINNNTREFWEVIEIFDILIGVGVSWIQECIYASKHLEQVHLK